MFGSVPQGHTSGVFYNQDKKANNPNQNHIGIDFHSLCLFKPVRIKYLLNPSSCMNSFLPNHREPILVSDGRIGTREEEGTTKRQDARSPISFTRLYRAFPFRPGVKHASP